MREMNKNKIKILYISMCVPYDNIRHAGGKTFNYYISSLAREENVQIDLIAKVLPDDLPYISRIDKNINTHLISQPTKLLPKILMYADSLNSKFNPKYPYGNVLTKYIYDHIIKTLLEMRNNGYYPDIIVLEWTWILLFIDKVKEIYPNAKYISSEHDVSYLGIKRNISIHRGLKKKYYISLYNNIKNRELRCVNRCDLTYTHNNKDKKLLEDDGIAPEKLDVLVPYYETTENTYLKSKFHSNDVVFYGAMNRIENEISAIWFIHNVMPMLEDKNIRFVILGNHPSNRMKSYESKKIHITGFVEDVFSVLSNSLCMVAPLQAGAGIKVKVLEAMAAGVPVLTNNIGIEGIPAINGKEFYYCNTPEEYENKISQLLGNPSKCMSMSRDSMAFIKKEFNLRDSYTNYFNNINRLLIG